MTEDNSQIIYLEADADITEVTRLFSQSKSSNIRLVVPAKSGLLRSSINLRLLGRQIKNSNKQVILVCPDQAIQKLILRNGLDVASTIKSEPLEAELILPSQLDTSTQQVQVVDQDNQLDLEEDSEHGQQIEKSDDLLVTKDDTDTEPEDKEIIQDPKTTFIQSDSKALSIPDFDHFRKRILIGLGLGLMAVTLVVIGVLLPRAEVKISLQADQVPVDLRLDRSEFTTGEIGQVTDSETLTTSVVASEEKDLGKVAQGQIVIQNCEDSDTHSLKKGARLTANGLVFELDQVVTIPAGIFSSGGTVCSTPLVEAGIKATDKGSDFNLSQASFDFADLSANFKVTGTTSGGESKIVKVVSQADIDTAKERLVATNSLDQSELVSRISQDSRVIEGSYAETIDQETVANPAGSQVDQTELKITVVSSLDYLENTAISRVLDQSLLDNSDGSKQIFDNGLEDAGLSYQDGQVIITTTGYLGPKFDQERIIKELRFASKKQVREIVKKHINYQDLQVNGGITFLSRMPIFDSKISLELEVTNI